MEDQVPEDALGRRVSCDGERGTVRFIGPVPPTAGLWLGVEWDDPDRGKHDGSHEGVRYFLCRHPKGGSFVRPKKASFGVDYLTAVREQYRTEWEEKEEEKIVISSKPVQMVGFDRISEKQKEERLEIIELRNCRVSGPGPENHIRTNTPHVVSLNLSGNLLSSWEAVASITTQLEQLTHLELSHNRLAVPSAPLAWAQAFSCLTMLSLKNCALTWPQLLECAPMWPKLEELYVSENDITELQRPTGVLQSLVLLDLSSNPLVEHTVPTLGQLPRLENLNMSKTGLSTIRFDDALPGSKTAMFPALKILSLWNNNISEWCAVNELAKLQSLVRLSCGSNPLLGRVQNPATANQTQLNTATANQTQLNTATANQTQLNTATANQTQLNPATANQMLLARLAQVEFLNNCEVTPEERRGAELDYCKMFARDWLESGGNRDPQLNQPSAAFTTQHPRYMELIQKYGAPEEGELKKHQPFALKNQLLSITFVCPDEMERKPMVKKLPDSMTVQKVKGLLYRLLKIPGVQLKLSYSTSKMADMEIDIDNDLRSLQFYSIEDGDKILVRWS